MLAQLGPLVFDLSVNLHETAQDTEGRWVEKPVLGRRPPLEYIGDGPESFTLNVKLFPAQLGGLTSVDQLKAMRQSGQAQHFMRGDGVPHGWFVVEKASVKSSYLGGNGVGRMIDVDITIKRADPPGVADLFTAIAGML